MCLAGLICRTALAQPESLCRQPDIWNAGVSLALCLPGVGTAQILGPLPPERGICCLRGREILISTWQEGAKGLKSLGEHPWVFWGLHLVLAMCVGSGSPGILPLNFKAVLFLGDVQRQCPGVRDFSFVSYLEVAWVTQIHLALLPQILPVRNGDGTRMCPWGFGSGRAKILLTQRWMLPFNPYHPIPGHSHCVGIELELLAKR